jgi:hypothetical protein
MNERQEGDEDEENYYLEDEEGGEVANNRDHEGDADSYNSSQYH